MKKVKILLLTLFLAALTACFEVPEIAQQPPTPAPPTATPRLIQATPTLAPLPTVTKEGVSTEISDSQPARVANEPAPALIEFAMFDQASGWGRSDEFIYRTSDGGKTWQAITLMLPETHTFFNATYVDAQTIYLVSVDMQNPPALLHITRNGGQTWTQSELPGLAPGFARVIALNPETLFLFEDLGSAAGSQGVALSRSRDGGQTWEQTFAHIPGETQDASLPFGGQKSLPAFLDSDLGFIGGSRPVENETYFFRTQDAGRTWQPKTLPVPASISNYMAMVQTPITFTYDSQTIIAPVSFSLPQGDPQLIFFSSNDRGETWRASVPLAYGDTYHFIDPLNAWVWADGTLHKTQNGGQTWLPLTTNLPNSASINNLQFVDSETGLALVFELDFQTRLYATRDGGQTWETLSP